MPKSRPRGVRSDFGGGGWRLTRSALSDAQDHSFRVREDATGDSLNQEA